MKQLLFILIAFCMANSTAGAKNDHQIPKSELRKVFYRVSGGMLPYDQDYIDLRIEKDGQKLLTLKADCPGETVTFEVDDSVFRHCEKLVIDYKLYKAEGHYKAPGDMVVLDAPTSTFDLYYKDPQELYTAGGWIPSEISKGIRAISEYLYGLRGDRQAIGHLDIIRHAPSDPEPGDYTNGVIDFTPDENGIEELYKYLAGKLGVAYDESDWDYSLAKGSGFKALIVYNERESYMDIFNEKTTIGHAIQTDGNLKSKYPQASQRLLTRKDLAEYDNDTLTQICQEVMDRYDYRKQPSDLEQQNLKLADYLLLWNKRHPKETQE